MSMSDPLADMLTRIRNALMAHFESVEIPGSKLKVSVAEILKREGYIRDYHVRQDGVKSTIVIDLKYDAANNAVITGLKRVSKPGRRVYVRHDRIPRVMSGLGIAVVSTSKGVMTDREARRQKVGGEVLCNIW